MKREDVEVKAGARRLSEQEKKTLAVGRLRYLLAEWERSHLDDIKSNHTHMWGLDKGVLDYNDLKFVVESFQAGAQASYVARAQIIFDNMKAALDRQTVALTRLLKQRMAVMEVIDSARIPEATKDRIRKAFNS